MHVSYLIGCDNELAQLHTRHPEACDKVGGVIIMHIDDLRKFALLWLHKTEEVRADKAHYARNITGDIYESGWISEMYGYSFGAAEVSKFLLMASPSKLQFFIPLHSNLWDYRGKANICSNELMKMLRVKQLEDPMLPISCSLQFCKLYLMEFVLLLVELIF